MKFFRGLLLYMILGGLIIGYSLADYDRRCPDSRKVSATEAALVFATWPAWIVAAVFYGDGDKSCPAEE